MLKCEQINVSRPNFAQIQRQPVKSGKNHLLSFACKSDILGRLGSHYLIL